MDFRTFADPAMRLIMRILLQLDFQGMDNVPRDGPLIVAINHTSFFDPLLVTAFVTARKITPLAKEELFRIPLFGWMFPAYGAIPIRRGAIDRRAIKRALEILRRRHALLLAPEGTRSADGQLQRGRSGVSLLAIRTNAIVLPVAIWGVHSFWRNLRRFKRTTAHVSFGQPLRISIQDRKIPREQLDSITDEIMYRLAEMLPPENRGVYRDLARATGQYVSPAGPSQDGILA